MIFFLVPFSDDGTLSITLNNRTQNVSKQQEETALKKEGSLYANILDSMEPLRDLSTHKQFLEEILCIISCTPLLEESPVLFLNTAD